MELNFIRGLLAQMLSEYAEQFAVELALADNDIERIKELTHKSEMLCEFGAELHKRLEEQIFV